MSEVIKSDLIKENKRPWAERHAGIFFPVLLLVLVLCVLASLMIGRYPLSLGDIIQAMLNRIAVGGEGSVAETILFNVRIPRIMSAVCIGGALSIAGASFQSVFKNPMVSPDLLGVTSGAGFGASLAILLRLAFWKVQLCSFLCGFLAVMVTITIGRITSRGTGGKVTLLILCGMIVGTLFKSFISMAKYLADPNDALPEITFWLMGSLSGVDNIDFLKIVVPVGLGIIPMLFLRWKLNGMACGDEEARAMGIETEKIRILVIFAATIVTSAGTSICGIIGWVGLIIPHITRMITGPDNRYLIPFSLVLGGIYLLLVDNISRTVFPVEIPLGILTSVIGAPFFLYLLIKTRRAWE